MLLRVPVTVKFKNHPPIDLTVKVNHPDAVASTAILSAQYKLGITTPTELEFIV